MVAKKDNGRKPMSVIERVFWRDMYQTAWNWNSAAAADDRAAIAAHEADRAIEEYRLRVTWRNT